MSWKSTTGDLSELIKETLQENEAYTAECIAEISGIEDPERRASDTEHYGQRQIRNRETRESFQGKTDPKELVPMVFQLAENSSWDLWSAAPCIAECTLEGLEIKGASKAPGWGPVLNQMAQSENFEDGLCCVALLEAGLITEEDAADWGFDT